MKTASGDRTEARKTGSGKVRGRAAPVRIRAYTSPFITAQNPQRLTGKDIVDDAFEGHVIGVLAEQRFAPVGAVQIVIE